MKGWGSFFSIFLHAVDCMIVPTSDLFIPSSAASTYSTTEKTFVPLRYDATLYDTQHFCIFWGWFHFVVLLIGKASPPHTHGCNVELDGVIQTIHGSKTPVRWCPDHGCYGALQLSATCNTTAHRGSFARDRFLGGEEKPRKRLRVLGSTASVRHLSNEGNPKAHSFRPTGCSVLWRV